MYNIRQAAEKVLALAVEKGQKDVDVFAERKESLEVNILDEKVEKIEQSTSLGLGIRVINEGRTGIASTERLTLESISNTFNNACENSKIQDSTKVVMLNAPKEIPDTDLLGVYNSEIDDLTTEELVEYGMSIECSAKSADKRVFSIPYLGVARGKNEYFLFSSRGVSHIHKSNEVSAWCGPLLMDGDSRKSGLHFLHRRELDKEKGKQIGIEAVRKAAEMLNAKPISSCKLPVVLDEYTAPKLLGMFFGAFYAEFAQRGMSRLESKLGKKISISGITLLDDPHLLGGNRSCFLDAEGCLTSPLPIIEDGVFCNFLYNVESASKEGKISTGHAVRSFSGGISTRFHNLIWPKGDQSLEELCTMTKKCLLVTKLEGQSGCNTVSGDISIGVQGFLVENGHKVQPVESVTLAGNFFDILMNIKGSGNIYQPEISHCFIPALLIEGMMISG